MEPTSSSLIPLYHQIYLVLRDQCTEDHDGSVPLPSELDLARQYKVSRVTMRKALDQLVKEGLVTRRRGAGTFVNPVAIKQRRAPRDSTSLLENLISSALDTTVRVVRLERIVPPQDIADTLQLAAKERVIKAIRVRSLDNIPVSQLTTFVPESMGESLQAEALEARPMLTLLEEHGIKVDHAQQVLTARLADSEVAARLDVPVGAPLIAVKRLVWEAGGRPVQLLQGLYRPDRYEYRMTLGRMGDGEARVWYQRDGKPSS